MPCEDSIKLHAGGVVSNVVMIGDKRKYNTCLITLKQVVDAEANDGQGGFVSTQATPSQPDCLREFLRDFLALTDGGAGGRRGGALVVLHNRSAGSGGSDLDRAYA